MHVLIWGESCLSSDFQAAVLFKWLKVERDFTASIRLWLGIFKVVRGRRK